MSGQLQPRHTPMVVIADHDPDSRLILPTALRHAGYQCTPTPDGEEALELAERHRAELLITELYIPARGRPCIVAVASSELATRPKVMVYTAHAMPEDRQWALDAGCDTVLYKPTPVRELLATVRQLLDRTPGA